ncbi:hypothetical protein BDW42DRAFT_56631 [Aspergillus taichungensis]|uniref:Carrier domain-containing protein n=1 Tax=Aspergillus taichungensis TaxID=482145 RepID=A0A2J5I9J9_9EURO|nr:hypothetical protein BDW42DRAFT_56631 [Aspergillus taichungensis]
MKLVRLAQEEGLPLSVEMVFQSPTLASQAAAVMAANDFGARCEPMCIADEIGRFELITGGLDAIEDVIYAIMEQCKLQREDIEDVYPCTSMQEGLIAQSARVPGANLMQHIFEIQPQVNDRKLMQAWNTTVAENPLLRTRITRHGNGETFQVVTTHSGIGWEYHHNLNEYLLKDRRRVMGLGDPLFRVALITATDMAHRPRYLVTTLHHAIFDAWSKSLLLKHMDAAYHLSPTNPLSFKPFVKFVTDTKFSAQEYWRQELEGFSGPQFPIPPCSYHVPMVSSKKSITASLLHTTGSDFTASTWIQLGWALTLYHYTFSTDIVFGTTLTGRGISIPRLDEIAGPTLTTVPLRITLDPVATVRETLDGLQKRSSARIPHEHLGLQHIRRLNDTAELACHFQNLLVFQTGETSTHSSKLLREIEGPIENSVAASAYPLILLINPSENETIDIEAVFDDMVIEPLQVGRILDHFGATLTWITQNSQAEISAVPTISPKDGLEIYERNALLSKSKEYCIHALISQQAQLTPASPALSSWDGDMSYQDLNELSSRLARYLKGLGAGREVRIALYIERSKWVVMAALAVLQTGATVLILEPSYPTSRLATMCTESDATIILASPSNVDQAHNFGCFRVVPIGEGYVEEWSAKLDLSVPTESHQTCRPDDAAFILFTSGSTGKPKGIHLEHRNLASVVLLTKDTFQLTSRSRLVHLAAYAFDVSIYEIIAPLLVGGCVCIPNETMRRSAPAAAMNLFRATVAVMTPTVSRILQPSSIPALETLVLGGEPTTQEDIRRWGSSVRLFSGYGSAECCVISAVRGICDESDTNIIEGGGLSTIWIVNPSDHSQLAPVGAIGEIVIEGPNVSRGYLNDPVKTRESFIPPPKWLTGLRGDINARLYKSGDLAQYAANGALRYIGRKDNQAKLNGQRLELEEIEEHARRCLLKTGDKSPLEDVLASIVQPPHNGRPVLLVFVQIPESVIQLETNRSIFSKTPEFFHQRTSGVQTLMSDQLPSYMVPAAFVPVSRFPTTASGKKDLRELQRIISHLSETEWQRITGFTRAELRDPSTATEARILEIARQVLGNADVNVDDNFFRVGGDSIVAMRLIALAQENGMDLAVTDIYLTPVFSGVARVIDDRINQAVTAQPLQHIQLDRFSLLDDSIRATAISTAQKLCTAEIDEIEDIYPCTPLQEGMLASTLAGSSQGSDKYVSSLDYQLPNSVSVDRLKNAWEVVLKATPILRTRIIPVGNQTLQLVIRGERALRESALHVTGFDKPLQENIQFGAPLVQTRVTEEEQGKRNGLQLFIAMHHALYDAWTVPLILSQFQKAYETGTCDVSPSLGPFVNYLLQNSGLESESFWKADLAGLEISHFPHVPSSSYEAVQHNTVSHHLPLPCCRRLDTTLATAIQLAWGITISQYTNSWDVVYGLVASGRDVPIRGIESMAGPTISTVPLRLLLQPDSTVADTLLAMQDRTAQRLPFAHFGLQNISHLSEDSKFACQFQNLLVVQAGSSSDKSYLFSNPIRNPNKNRSAFDTHALTLTCEPTGNNDALHVKAFYDPGIISQSQMVLIIDHFSFIVGQVVSQPSRTLSQVAGLSPQHSQKINRWNPKAREAVTSCLHDLVAWQWRKHPHRLAVSAWDGDLSYNELEKLSLNVALHLQHRYSVGPGTYVPVLAHKSKWAVVAIMAIIRAGGAFILLPTPQSRERLGKLTQIVNAKFMVTTSAVDARLSDLDISWMVLNDKTQCQNHRTQQASLESKVSPHDPIYIIFTSGSTGTPKAIIIHHAAFATNAVIAGSKINYNSDTRVLQYSSYAFDVSIAEIFYTLVHGGCILIPKESEMRDNLPRVVSIYRANRVEMTPSLLRSIEPADFPWVENLCLSGEAPQATDIDKWARHVNLINAYGPAECAVDSSSKAGFRPGDEPNNIGHGMAAVCWVVVENDLEKLAPIGSIGELLVEGPIVGRGYLNDPERTAESFIQAPGWLKQLRNIPNMQCYRTGDLVKYSPRGDGSLLFVGRKDNQIKLRGQRIELGEVEFHIRSLWDTAQDIVVDVITPANSEDRVLTAFIVAQSSLQGDERQNPNPQTDGDEIFVFENTEMFYVQALEVQRNLHSRLPHFMVPALFLPLQRLPLNSSGKIDRRTLKQAASALPRHALQSYQGHHHQKQPPRGSAELVLQQLIAAVFELPTDEIGMDDNFFHLGGDSIAAMRLCGHARTKGLSLGVADIFHHPRLQDLAAAMSASSEVEKISVEPFSLINANPNEVVEFAAKQCGVDGSTIADIYPCTPMQEALVALSLKQEGAYVARFVLELHDYVDLDTFRRAWYAVVEANPILRTRIIHEPLLGALQVVLHESTDWRTFSSADNGLPISNGGPLIAYGFGKPNQFWIMAHHSLYDELSLQSIFAQISSAYTGNYLAPRPVNAVIQYFSKIHIDEARAFWINEVGDTEAPIFPESSSWTIAEGQMEKMSYSIPFQQDPRLKSFTISTIIKLAWALTISQYTGSTDILFGTVSFGRGIPVPGIEQTTCPTIATLPTRISVQKDQSAWHMLKSVQDQSTQMIAHEQVGLHRIRQWTSGAGCDFQNLLVVQPSVEGTGSIHTHKNLFTVRSEQEDDTRFGIYPLTLTCALEAEGVNLSATFDSHLIDSKCMERIFYQFMHNMEQLNSSWDRPLAQITPLNARDATELQSWNAIVPDPINTCVHDLIEHQVRSCPSAEAICAWDGRLTYSELGQISSVLAEELVKLHIGPGSVIPIYIPRSQWIPVVLTAIAKTGAAFLLLEVEHPLERLRGFCEQVKAPLVVCLRQDIKPASSICTAVFPIDIEHKEQWLSQSINTHQRYGSSNDLCYVVFTSGSTGHPKGAMITHQSVCSVVVRMNQATGCGPDTRHLLTTSLAFDLSIASMFIPLISGGCVCVPADITDLPGSISQLRANMLCCTNTVLRELHPEHCATIQKVSTGGEPLTKDVLAAWSNRVQLIQVYGPAECAVFSTVNTDMAKCSDPSVVGKPLGCRPWIVDPERHDHLMPIGAIGELLIDGPIVGLGYIHDPEKTELSFVQRPPWLTETSHSRVYRTGDLVQYTSDGQLRFIGRKDRQIKIYGQRIEPGEIEYHIHQALSPLRANVVVEVVHPNEGDGRPMLVAFVCLGTNGLEAPSSTDDTFLAAWSDQFREIVSKVRQQLRDSVPRYMIPGAFIPISYVPCTGTRKADRRRLRVAAEALQRHELVRAEITIKEHRTPTSATERALCKLFARALSIPSTCVSADIHFLHEGGDSVLAMRLVALARQEGLTLTVGQVFDHPVLSDLALTLDSGVPGAEEVIKTPEPFSLLAIQDHQAIRRVAAEQCNVSVDQIEDIYPCTPLQQGLMTLSLRRPGEYVFRQSYDLPLGMNIDRWREAWKTTVQSNPILRTRVIEVKQPLQAVIRDNFFWEWISESREPTPEKMGLGCPLIQLASTRNLDPDQPNRFFLAMHHGLYDSWTLSSIMDQVHAAYHDQVIHAYPFSHFIQYLAQSDHELTEEYWRLQFKDFNAVPFPSLPSVQYLPRPTQLLNHTSPVRPPSGIMAANLLKLAWAITLSHYTSSSDVVFGNILSGRDVALPGIDRAVGPTITTVPFPVRLELDSTVENALRKLQDQSIRMIPFAHCGLQNIRRLNAKTQVACLFQSLLVIQPRREVHPHEDWITSVEDEKAEGFHGTYAVVLLCHLSDGAVHVRVQHDPNVVKSDEIRYIVSQFSHIISLLSEDPQCLIKNINRVNSHGVLQLQQWAGPPPQRVNDCVHRRIEEICLKQPEAPAVCAWDGDLTYSQLESLSAQLGICLRQSCVGPEVVVPVCLEKSRWAIVCMMAILKAGGAFLLLDPSQPIDRLQRICTEVQPRVILSSERWVPHCTKLAPAVISVSNEELDWQTAVDREQPAAQVQSTNSLYTVFTSGSTGTPKGIVVDHSAFCSLALPALSSIGITSRSRILQFSSYAFDISILETLLALLSGGCICIPSNKEKRDHLGTAATRMKANVAFFTPSVARALQPAEFPTIDTLLIGGETPQLHDLKEWIQRARVMSSYGPAECCPAFTAGSDLTLDSDPRNIGRPLAGDCWIVDPSDYNRLVPIGIVGELVLGGPTISRGYINDAEATDRAFISDLPPWIKDFRAVTRETRLYKTGDLVQYSSDGSLRFIGRKDTQVKVRGQRVELGEIESAINQSLPGTLGVAVELVKGPSTGENGSLVAFIALGDLQEGLGHHRNCGSDTIFNVPSRKLQTVLTQLNQTLSRRIPSYMIPTRYLILHRLPVTRSQKIDRQLLRSHALALSSEELDLYSSVGSTVKKPPTNDREVMVRQICASVLHRAADMISMSDSFFDIGGDSIVALRLVHEARKNDINFTVSDIFTYPHLFDLAVVSARNSAPNVSRLSKQKDELDPYLVQGNTNDVSNALAGFGLPTHNVQLILPVTDGQIMRLHEQFHHFTFELFGTIDTDRLEIACRTLIKRHEILRTIFHRINGTICQVIFQDLDISLARRETSNIPSQIDDICHEDDVPPPALGIPITKFTLVRESPDRHILIMRLSHAQYDGISIELLVEELKSLYTGQNLLDSTAFSDHIHECMHQKRSLDARSFWRARLEGSSISYIGRRDRVQDATMCQEEHHITTASSTVTCPSVKGITVATIVNTAWSIVLSQRTDRLDVLFGTATNGRNGYSSQGGNLIGLCMNQTPMRVMLDHSETVQCLLETVQRQYIQAMPFELVELSDIAESCGLSHPTSDKVEFGSVVVVQNANVNTDAPFSFGDVQCIRGHVGTASRRPYVMVEVSPSESGLSVELYAPANAITQTDAQSIVAELCEGISLLAVSLDKPLGQVLELPLSN